jgi:aerobic carbon-monoxide dehydrogenase medium subunit
MKPPPFDYHRAVSAAEAIDVLAERDDAKIIAGGQSLIPLMNLRLARPAVLVDINPVSELDYVTVDDDGTTRLGCLCRQARIEADPGLQQPLLRQAAAHVAHPQVRARGTLGGCLAHADPASELPAALVALGATVAVAGPGGRRREIPVKDLASGFLTTILDPDELLIEVAIAPQPPRSAAAFREIAPRHGDFATAGVAVQLSFDADGSCASAAAAGCGLAPAAVDLEPALEPLIGEAELSDRLLGEVAGRVWGDVEPADDLHASAQDRRDLAEVLIVDAVRSAWGDRPSRNGEGAG